MINYNLLSDAVPITLFCMFALWAAGTRRRWFVRLAVVCAALFVTLLVPAYEVVIQFGVEMLLVVVGLAAWRAWRKRRIEQIPTKHESVRPYRLQLSLETLLLFTVVVAVGTAVAARAPHFELFQWVAFIGVGALAALGGLVSVWLVFGRAVWWIRLFVAPLLVALLGLSTRWLWIGRNLIYYWTKFPNFVPQYWETIRGGGVWAETDYWLKTAALSVFLLSVWVLLMRTADWFDPFAEREKLTKSAAKSAHNVAAARWAARGLFVLVSLFPLLLLYRLLTPTPIPDLAGPRPGGFDALVAAGKLVADTSAANSQQVRQLSPTLLQAWTATTAEACDAAHLALQTDCRFPLVGAEGTVSDDELHALNRLGDALWARTQVLIDRGPIEERIVTNLDLLRFNVAQSRSSGVVDELNLFDSLYELSECRDKLSAEQCIELATQLWQLDAMRAPWERRLANQRIIDAHAGWERHLQAILDEWAHADRPGERRTNSLQAVELRILLTGLVLQAYELKHGQALATLSELIPEYLPAVPADPFDESQPIRYYRNGDQYVLFSVGPNQVPDGVAGAPRASDEGGDDLVQSIYFPEWTAQPRAEPTDKSADESNVESPPSSQRQGESPSGLPL